MIVVVTGPPCGGKSTYVKEQFSEGDLMIDMDMIALSLSPSSESHSYDQTVRNVARAARNAAVGETLKQMQGQRNRTAFIIHSDPPPEMRRTYRAMGAHFVECDPGRDECLRRLKSRPHVNQQLVRGVIDDYYAKRL